MLDSNTLSVQKNGYCSSMWDGLSVRRVTKRQFMACKNPADKLQEKCALT